MPIPTFEEICSQMIATHKAKNTDYGSSWNNYKIFLGLPPSVGLMSRILDKVGRSCNIMRRGTAAVQSESLQDTLLDLAVYSILTLIEVMKEEESKTPTAITETQCFNNFVDVGKVPPQE